MTRAASALTEPSSIRRRPLSAPVEPQEAAPTAVWTDLMIDRVGTGVACADARGLLTLANPAFKASLGLDDIDVIGMPLQTLADPDQLEELQTRLTHVLAGTLGEARLDLKREFEEGPTLWVDLQLRALRDADGCIVGLLVSTSELTDRKQQEALTLQRHVLAMQNAGLGLWSWDIPLNTMTFDMLWAMALGCAVSELPPISETWCDRMHPDDWPALEKAMMACLKGETAEFAVEHRMRHAAGHWTWLFTTGMVTQRSTARRALQMVGTSQDITQRKTAEAALAESRRRQSLALQSARLGQWEWHVPTGEAHFDDRFCAMFGYAPSEFAPHRDSWARLDFAEDCAATLAEFEAFINGSDDEYHRVRRLRHSLGHPVWVIDAGCAIERDAQGRIVRLVGVYQDISEQKQLEATLIEAKEVADAASRAKGDFLANMSHEIRTPMNAIIGLTRLVLDTEMNSRQRDYLTKVHSASKALLGILNDVLDYSKIEAGRMDLEQIQFSLEEPLNSVANLFGAQVEQKGLELFFEMAPSVPMEVIGDPMRLTQVLNNLVGNAIKFTERGEIRIKVELASRDSDVSTLRFSVSDTGIGLSSAQAARLFQAFTQADNSVTRKYGGTGLGLTISQKLVALMNGEITVSSVEGQGCTFCFTVQVKRAGVQPHPDLHRLSGLRALVVDDQETSRLIMENMFGAWGVQVQTSADPVEGLARVRENQERGTPYDIVLLDWRMPEMNGLELARAMRAQTGPGHCPPFAVMVTAFGREQLLNEAGDVALDVVLTKPVVPSALFDILTRLKQPGGAPVPAVTRAAAAPAAVRFDGARILLAEDNFLNQEVASEFLASYGAVVTVAGDGAQALALAQSNPFDMVLMDLHMPVMDGIESARSIRALPQGDKLPIVAMTAAVMSEDRGRCESAGMVDFVAKPIDPDDLVRAMRRWLPTFSAAKTHRQGDAGAPPAGAPGARRAAADGKLVATPASSLFAIKLEGFDPGAALRRMRGNEERLMQLLRTFCKQHADALTELRMMLARDDREGAMLQLHSIKGVAGTLGLMPLADAAGELEAQIRAGRLPFDETALAGAMAAALAALGELTPPPADAPPVALTEAQRDTLQRMLGTLSRYVREQELVPDELIDELKQLASGAPHGARLSQLCQHLFDFDHAAALNDLQQISATLDLVLEA